MQPLTDVTSHNLPIRIRTLITRLSQYLRYLDKRLYLVAIIIVVFVAASTYTVVFFWPRTLLFSYAGPACVQVPTLFPSLHTLKQPDSYSLSQSSEIKVGNFPVLARKTCATLAQPLTSNISEHAAIHILGTPLTQILTIKSAAPPEFTPKQTQSNLVAVNDTVTYTLNTSDATFKYSLVADDKEATCTTVDVKVSCNITPLKLAQGQQYKLKIKRSLNGSSTIVSEQTVTTVEPLVATGTTIPAGSIVYNAPTQIILTFNKAISNTGSVSVRSGSNNIGVTTQAHDNQIIVNFTQPLARSALFEVSVANTTAVDKGYLVSPFTTTFTTSGGPKVTNISVGQSRISTNPTINLTFDTSVNPSNIGQYITADTAGIGSIQASNNVVTLRLARALAPCEALTFHVSDKLTNSYGVSGNNAWSYTSRAACGTSFSIGTSVEGRPITGWQFGSGTSVVLYVGATHGSELSSKIILDAWITYLDSNTYKLPANRKIVVIPAVNPDGVAHNNRLNAHNVDLNRNFPANNWKADVTVPGGQLVQNGGGTAPLSEPESAALAHYTQSLNPRLVLTYHSKASLITANESGDSMSLATAYGRITKYGVLAESNLGNTFDYDTTGAYEDWLHDKVNIPALLIELPGHTAQYFISNQSALWLMANS